MQAYPRTDLSDNAQFWIGESRYARGDISGALSAFRETLQLYPGGNKVPDALVKEGDCLAGMGDRDGARIAVVVAYPGGAPEAGPLYSLGDLTAGLVAVWGAAESFSYWDKLRKRLALGLADPVTTAQFRMWGTSFTFASAAGFIVAGATIVLKAPITGFPAALVAVQICLVGTTGLTWLAFYPPQRFQAWMRARHTATARP